MANKKQLIEREELFADIEILYQKHYVKSYDKTIHDIFNAVRRRIRRCPTVEAVEVVHGRWDDDHCTNCMTNFTVNVNGEDVKITGMKSNYCPNCGAKMDGDGNA